MFEMIRFFILSIGWPFLIVGSVIIMVKARRFYLKTNKLALGKLIIAETVGVLISMYALGVVSTDFMFFNVERGTKVVLPIFLIWFVVMVTIYIVAERWREEAGKINILYYRIKERSEQLRQEKSKLFHIAQHMDTGAVLLDNNGKPMFINREAKMIIGSKTDNEKKLLEMLYKKFSKYKLKSHVQRCLTGEPSNILNVTLNDKIYEIYLRCLVEHNAETKGCLGHFIWIRDVTEEKLLVQAENKFMTAASHRLRTPLSGVKWNLETLQSGACGKLSVCQKKCINDMEKSLSLMSNVVNQLLCASETSIRKMKVNIKKVQLEQLLKESINNLQDLAEKKNVKIVFDWNKKMKYAVQSDPEFIKTALNNLIGNALIYSTGKKAKVMIDLKKTDSRYEISIQDQGIGIPKISQNYIFTKFFRAENAIKVYTEGVGLNLHLSKHMMESVGGKIWFESKENKGSTFYLSFPVKLSKARLNLS